jgi:AraC-like DNA-binding protein
VFRCRGEIDRYETRQRRLFEGTRERVFPYHAERRQHVCATRSPKQPSILNGYGEQLDLWQTIERAEIHRHSHDHPYAAVVLRGGYEEAGDSGRFFVSEGDVVLHHSFGSHLNRIFPKKVAVLNLPLIRLPIEAAGAWRAGQALDEICRAAERSERDAADLLLSLSLNRATSKLDWPDLLSAALRSNRSLWLEEWASAHGLSPWAVSRGFRQVFGITPEAFRLRAKTHRAFQMIRRSRRPLAAIAAEAGFSDQAHMSRSIKALSGESPRKWRSAANGFKTESA